MPPFVKTFILFPYFFFAAALSAFAINFGIILTNTSNSFYATTIALSLIIHTPILLLFYPAGSKFTFQFKFLLFSINSLLWMGIGLNISIKLLPLTYTLIFGSLGSAEFSVIKADLYVLHGKKSHQFSCQHSITLAEQPLLTRTICVSRETARMFAKHIQSDSSEGCKVRVSGLKTELAIIPNEINLVPKQNPAACRSP